MSATIWTKFFWADWLSDANLRRCSPAGRGFWMDMLCIAAQHDPIGYLCVNGEALSTSDMARIAGVSEAEAHALTAELVRNGVCSRDRKGHLYSRRMVRDAQALARAKNTGQIGGRSSHEKQKGIFAPSKGVGEGGLAPRVQEPYSKSPESQKQSVASAPLLRACQAMGVSLEALRRHPAWMVFGDFYHELLAQGCEAERDVWPTIERLSARLGRAPSSPAYFKAAILEARDRRLAAPQTRSTAALEWQDRLAAFRRDGVWSSKWGPKPGEAGCLVPDELLTKAA